MLPPIPSLRQQKEAGTWMFLILALAPRHRGLSFRRYPPCARRKKSVRRILLRSPSSHAPPGRFRPVRPRQHAASTFLAGITTRRSAFMIDISTATRSFPDRYPSKIASICRNGPSSTLTGSPGDSLALSNSIGPLAYLSCSSSMTQSGNDRCLLTEADNFAHPWSIANFPGFMCEREECK